MWSVAEQAGAERRAKFEKTMNRIFGLPEAAQELAKIGGEKVQAKAEEIKGKAIDLKERTEQKATEIKDRWVSRFERTRDNLLARAEDLKDKTVAKAIDLRDRAIKAGIETGLSIENKIVAICEIPAKIYETRAAGREMKVAKGEEKLESVKARQFAEQNGLSEEQTRALEALLAKHAMETIALQESHGLEKEELEGKITKAQEKAVELRGKSAEIRENVDKRRIFKNLIGKLG